MLVANDGGSRLLGLGQQERLLLVLDSCAVSFVSCAALTRHMHDVLWGETGRWIWKVEIWA